VNQRDFTPFPSMADAVGALNIAALKLATLAELFGHDVETGGYPTLQSAESRQGVFFSLKDVTDVIHKACSTFEQDQS
jgi:hypothetical protein